MIKIKQTALDNKWVLPLLFASAQEQLIQEGEILAAYWEDEICGAVGMVKKGNVTQILSLYVKDAWRRKGIGSKLVAEAVNRAGLQKSVSVSLEYSCTEEENIGITEFFLKNGFVASLPGSVLYYIPMNTLENSMFASQRVILDKIENNISKIFELPQSMWDMDKIPDYMLPDRAPGRLRKDLCLAYVSKGEIRAFIVMCETKDQTLHLHSAFLEDSSYGGYLIGLLQKAITTIKEKDYHFQTLTVTGATIEGKKLIERLLQGAQIMKKTAYTAEYPLQKNEFFQPAGFYGTYIRLNTLADALEEKEIDSDLVILDGVMPYMELPIEGTDSTVRIEYEALGGEEYTGFVLKAFYAFEIESESGEDSLDWENILHENIVLLEGEEGERLLYGSYEEDSTYDAERSIEEFIIPFIKCVKKVNN